MASLHRSRSRRWSACSARVIGAVALVGLASLSCRRGGAPPRPEQVLFVCEHGAAKSVLAATVFNELAAARGLSVRATARGADPQDAASASTVSGLQGDGLTPVVDRPQPLTAADIRRSERVVAFDCDLPTMKGLQAMDSCWNGVPTVSDGYARARDDIRARVTKLVEETAQSTASAKE